MRSRDDNVFFIERATGKKTYGRDGHNAQFAVEEILENKYGVSNVHLTPSGLAACAAVFNSFSTLYPEGIIYYGNEIYTETAQLIRHLKCKKLSCGDLDEILELLDKYLEPEKEGEQAILIFFESCSNPSGKIPKFEFISKIREKINGNESEIAVFVVIDNTWLSSAVFNPFDLDLPENDNVVDIVVTSLTKYYSGGTVICGAIITNNSSLFIDASNWLIINGSHVSPFTCKLLLDNLPSMEDRLQKSSVRTYEIISHLYSANPKITIYHPFVQRKQFVEQNFKKMKNSDANQSFIPGVIYFKANLRKEEIGKVDVERATSYGARADRVDIGHGFVRFAVGFDGATPLDQIELLAEH